MSMRNEFTMGKKVAVVIDEAFFGSLVALSRS
jgi:hypothetical protein